MLVGGMARVHCKSQRGPEGDYILWLSSVAIAATVERAGDVVAVKRKHESGFQLQNEMTLMENQTWSLLNHLKW